MKKIRAGIFCILFLVVAGLVVSFDFSNSSIISEPEKNNKDNIIKSNKIYNIEEQKEDYITSFSDPTILNYSENWKSHYFNFSSPDGYYYNDSEVLIQNKTSIKSNYNFYANYNYNINATAGIGSLVGVGYGSPTVNAGKLNLTGPAAKSVTYDSTNVNFTQTGAIRFNWIPNYNSPTYTYYLFGITTVGSAANRLSICHSPTSGGSFYIWINNASGYELHGSPSMGQYIVTKGTKYEIEFDFDFTNGATRLFINGVQFGSTIPLIFTRTSTNKFVVGNSGASNLYQNCYIDNFTIFNTVQHTSNYIPGQVASQTLYKTTSKSINSSEILYNGSLIAFDTVEYIPINTSIKYQLSDSNGSYWMYINSSGEWIKSNGSIYEANTSAEIKANLDTFPNNNGSLRWRTLLQSIDGLKTSILYSINITVKDIENPVWINEPENVSFRIGDHLRYEVSVDDISNVIFSINDSRFDLEQNGSSVVIVSHTEVGTYPITIIATDSCGNSINKTFVIFALPKLVIQFDVGGIDKKSYKTSSLEITVTRFGYAVQNVEVELIFEGKHVCIRKTNEKGVVNFFSLCPGIWSVKPVYSGFWMEKYDRWGYDISKEYVVFDSCRHFEKISINLDKTTVIQDLGYFIDYTWAIFWILGFLVLMIFVKFRLHKRVFEKRRSITLAIKEIDEKVIQVVSSGLILSILGSLALVYMFYQHEDTNYYQFVSLTLIASIFFLMVLGVPKKVGYPLVIFLLVSMFLEASVLTLIVLLIGIVICIFGFWVFDRKNNISTTLTNNFNQKNALVLIVTGIVICIFGIFNVSELTNIMLFITVLMISLTYISIYVVLFFSKMIYSEKIKGCLVFVPILFLNILVFTMIDFYYSFGKYYTIIIISVSLIAAFLYFYCIRQIFSETDIKNKFVVKF